MREKGNVVVDIVDRLVESTTTARELHDKMLELYPHRLNTARLWASARTSKK